MSGQSSLSEEKMSLPLQVETEQEPTLSQDVFSRRSTRFLRTGLSFAVLMLIGVFACAFRPFAPHASAEPSQLAFAPMVALGPRGVHPVRHTGVGRTRSTGLRAGLLDRPAVAAARPGSRGVRPAFIPSMTSPAIERQSTRRSELLPVMKVGSEADFNNVVDVVAEEDFEGIAPWDQDTIGMRVDVSDAVKDLRGLDTAMDEATSVLLEKECQKDQVMCEKASSTLHNLMEKTVLAGNGEFSVDDDELSMPELVDDGREESWWTKAVKFITGEPGGKRQSLSSEAGRTIEVWKFLSSAVTKVWQAGKMEGTEAEISAAKTAAALSIKDGLVELGTTYVKFGQVLSTQTDKIDKEYIAVLQDLQDNVPGFGAERAISIIEAELGKPIGEVFDSFEREPLAAASIGQVHRAVYKGKEVAVKVQRPGLKELFDADLKNLKTLTFLLDKFDDKSSGTDKSYSGIYEESARILYEEIDYTFEANNAARFKKSFSDIGIDYIRVPITYPEATTPRVLTMEFIDAIKMTDLDELDKAGLNKEQLAERIADAFLAQILQTTYLHCDPHPGNMQCDNNGNLVYFDMGMMSQLKPNVAEGFKEACNAIFSGAGPLASESQLGVAGKKLVAAFEKAGMVSPTADRLTVEKFARYFITAFQDIQQGANGPKNPAEMTAMVKAAVGPELQSLTEANVFRIPSTMSFVFRSLASIEGIGKNLSPETWDISKSAQPFVEAITEQQKGVKKYFSFLGEATGLRPQDINTALTQPKKVDYIEKTMRQIEQGDLKIRVRSSENEVALTRLTMTNQITNRLLVATMFLILWASGAEAIPAGIWLSGALGSSVLAAKKALKIRLFDKTQASFDTTFA